MLVLLKPQTLFGLAPQELLGSLRFGCSGLAGMCPGEAAAPGNSAVRSRAHPGGWGADPDPAAEGVGRGWRTAGTPSPQVIPKHIPQAQLELPFPCAHPRAVGSTGDSNPRDLPTHIPLRGDIAPNPHESSLIPKHLGSFCGRRKKKQNKPLRRQN